MSTSKAGFLWEEHGASFIGKKKTRNQKIRKSANYGSKGSKCDRGLNLCGTEEKTQHLHSRTKECEPFPGVARPFDVEVA